MVGERPACVRQPRLREGSQLLLLECARKGHQSFDLLIGGVLEGLHQDLVLLVLLAVLDCLESGLKPFFGKQSFILSDSKAIDEEREYLIHRSKIMDSMVDEAIGMVDSLDHKNDLLAEENQHLHI